MDLPAPNDEFYWTKYNELTQARDPVDRSKYCKVCGRTWGNHITQTSARLMGVRYYEFVAAD